MHETIRRLLASSLLVPVIALAACGGDDSDNSGGSPPPASDPGARVGPTNECAARLIEVVDADYMRERGVISEQGQEALFRLARERVIADVCSSIPAATPLEEAAEEVAQIIRSEAD